MSDACHISKIHLITSHSSGIIATIVDIVKDNTGNIREQYILLNSGCSSSILSDPISYRTQDSTASY